MATVTFTNEQVTFMLDILQQNGLLNDSEDIVQRAASLLQPHVRAAVTTKTQRVRNTTAIPTEELMLHNCRPIVEGQCCARKWGTGPAQGWGGQCTAKPQMGSDFCAKHATTKLSKKTSDGPDGSCLVCSKAQGCFVKHTYNWEHLGRYVPGQITLGPKWKCVEQTDCGQLVPAENIPSGEGEGAIEFFDTQSLEDMKQALDGNLPAEHELTHSVVAAMALEGEEFVLNYIQAREVTEMVSHEATEMVSHEATEMVSQEEEPATQDEDEQDEDESAKLLEAAAAIKAKQEQEAAAALKAKQEAEALAAAAALKAKQEAEAAAAIKAKQEGEAAAAIKAEALAAAAALKAKQEAEAAAALKAKQEAEAAAALKAKQEQEAAAALKAKQEQEAAAALKTRLEAERTEMVAKLEAGAKKTPQFDMDDDDTDSDEESEEDSDYDDSDDDEERPGAWATGGFMEKAGKMVGWIRETGEAYLMDPVTMAKGAQWGTINSVTGECTPLVY